MKIYEQLKNDLINNGILCHVLIDKDDNVTYENKTHKIVITENEKNFIVQNFIKKIDFINNSWCTVYTFIETIELTYSELTNYIFNIVQKDFYAFLGDDDKVWFFTYCLNENEELSFKIVPGVYIDGIKTLKDVAYEHFKRLPVIQGKNLVFDINSQTALIAHNTRMQMANSIIIHPELYSKYNELSEYSIFKSGRIEYVILDETLPVNDIVLFINGGQKNSVKPVVNSNGRHAIHPMVGRLGVICTVGEKSYRDMLTT